MTADDRREFRENLRWPEAHEEAAYGPEMIAQVRDAARILLEPWPWPRADGERGLLYTAPRSDDRVPLYRSGDPASADPLAQLGAVRARILLHAWSARDSLPPLPAWVPPRSFWTQALAVGLVTAHLQTDADANVHLARVDAFNAGFLHDAGILLLDPGLAETAVHHGRTHGLTFATAWSACHPEAADAPARASADFARTWSTYLEGSATSAAAALIPHAESRLPAAVRVARALVALRRMRAPCDHADPPLLEADLKDLGFTPETLADLFTDLAEITSRARRLLPHLRRAG